jgi:hypothetical protein
MAVRVAQDCESTVRIITIREPRVVLEGLMKGDERVAGEEEARSHYHLGLRQTCAEMHTTRTWIQPERCYHHPPLGRNLITVMWNSVPGPEDEECQMSASGR